MLKKAVLCDQCKQPIKAKPVFVGKLRFCDWLCRNKHKAETK